MKLAAFDIGANTTLMLAVETSADGGALRPILELSRITRLGKGVDKTEALDPGAANRTLDAIVEFADAARRAGVDRFTAVATSALRDARDGADFIARVRECSGVELKIISGREEAELSHLAVIRGLKIDPSARLLIVDIGGGSTELICAEPGHELQMTSLQMGSVRLTERIIHSDPPSASEIAKLREEIDSMLDTLVWNFKPNKLVGIAGTVTTVCAVALEMGTYDSARVHGHVLPRAEVSRVAALFGRLPLAERKRLKGLVEGRADVIFAGATILERLMERFTINEVIVSDQGVRWGLAWKEAERAL